MQLPWLMVAAICGINEGRDNWTPNSPPKLEQKTDKCVLFPSMWEARKAFVSEIFGYEQSPYPYVEQELLEMICTLQAWGSTKNHKVFIPFPVMKSNTGLDYTADMCIGVMDVPQVRTA